ncbi:hypothetical protein ASF69_01735 [Rhizobium sp. Leaf311]|uniref:hypothetical protein n=1 Tax=Rhizobium sp. Leaf311 TaxID=1736332 RepID=UPI0007161828|nr:hypothetical protein [Rhizobium sp. Leaf311]KQQ61171.1 hypothetical protein ASF69_01735 [Rhizobium sp. Leaf311]
MTRNDETREMVDVEDFLARWRADRVAERVAGQPSEFWAAVNRRLESSSDGTINMDQLIGLLHIEGSD